MSYDSEIKRETSIHRQSCSICQMNQDEKVLHSNRSRNCNSFFFIFRNDQYENEKKSRWARSLKLLLFTYKSNSILRRSDSNYWNSIIMKNRNSLFLQITIVHNNSTKIIINTELWNIYDHVTLESKWSSWTRNKRLLGRSYRCLTRTIYDGHLM